MTQDEILKKLDEPSAGNNTKNVHGGVVVNTDIDDYGML